MSDKNNNNEKRNNQNKYLGTGIGIGLVFGAAFGVLFNNVAIYWSWIRYYSWNSNRCNNG